MAIGDIVATLSVSGGSASFTLSINPGGFFAISGSNLVEAINTPAGTYSVTITATGPGISITQPISLNYTGSGSVGTFSLGLNLSGMEDNSGAPSLTEMSYFANRGLKIYRLPLSWQAIQSAAFGSLDGTAYLATLSATMANAASLGAKIIPDIHTFGVGPGKNALLQSSALSVSPWAVNSSSTSPVLTANAIAAPDGSTTATQIVFPAVSGAGNYSQFYQPVSTPTGPVTWSMYLKGSVGGEQVYLYGSQGTNTSVLCTLTTAWQRFSITSSSPGGSGAIVLGCAVGPGQTGIAAQTIYADWAQVEVGNTATAYAATTTSTSVKIGSAALPVTGFVDFWTKFSAWLRADQNHAAIEAYDLMNEWSAMDPNSTAPSTTFSQNLILSANSAVMTALRGAGDNTKLLLEWDHFSGAWDSVTNNIHLLFTLILSDPAKNSKASVHCYLNNDSSGNDFVWAVEIAKPGLAPPGLATNVNIFAQRMAPVVALAQSMGVPLHVGEMGWSNDALTLSPIGGNDDYADWNQAADNALAYCVANAIEITAWAAGPGFGLSYGYNPAPSTITSPGTKDFTSAGLQSTQMVILEKYSGYTGSQPLVYRVDEPFNAVPYAPSGTAIPNFKLRYNAKIASPIAFTGHASLADGTNVGGTFSPLTMPPGNNGLLTFSYTPAGTHKQISLTFTNGAGLTNPPAIGCSSSADRFISSSITPSNVYGLRLLYNVYAGPAIRLQRASDSAQQDFYFNTNGDLPRQAIQDWASSRSGIAIITIYDQSLNGQNIGYQGGTFATLTLNNGAGYPEVVFPANAQYAFNTNVGGNLQQTIIARVSDGNSGAFFISQDGAFPFRFAPAGYNVNNNSAAVTLADQVGVYHTYGGMFTANTTNGLVGYKDGSVTTQANTPAGGLASGSSFTTMGYFTFFHASQWTGAWTNLIILTTAINSTVMGAFSSDDASYYSTPLPDSLSATAPTISGTAASGIYGGTSQPLSGINVVDTNSGTPTDSVTITLTGAAATLTGTGLSGTGPYTMSAASAATITTQLQALTMHSSASLGSVTTLTLAVTSSAGPTATDSNTVVTVSAYGTETPYAAPSGTFTPINHKGINIAGGENSSPIYATNFFGQIDYFASKGFGLIRMPIQPGNMLNPAATAFAPFNISYITTNIKAVIDHCFAKNIYVIIDPHSFGNINTPGSPGFAAIGTSVTANNAFADWWSRMASLFSNYPNVIFGLMNEPVGMTVAQWYTGATNAINAIRNAGATQLITIPGGTNFTGAHDWVTSGNAAQWAGYNGDTANNFVFEMHQYLDFDNSGSHPIATQNGSTILSAATSWARTNGFKILLGEGGFAPDPWKPNASNNMNYDSTQANITTNGITQGTNMWNYMSSNSDVWMGWSYWVAGDFGSQPTNGGYSYSAVFNVGDQPQVAVLVANL